MNEEEIEKGWRFGVYKAYYSDWYRDNTGKILRFKYKYGAEQALFMNGFRDSTMATDIRAAYIASVPPEAK